MEKRDLVSGTHDLLSFLVLFQAIRVAVRGGEDSSVGLLVVDDLLGPALFREIAEMPKSCSSIFLFSWQRADSYKHATICFSHETYTNLTQLSFGRQLRHKIVEV